MLRGTPLHPRTARLCEAQNWRRWSGYVVASSYELTHDREYAAIRNSAALLDLSPLFKYQIAGPDAARLLDRIVTRDVATCKVGQVMYTPWCDERGKVIDDGTIARLDDRLFRLTSADPSLRWLHQNAIGLNVTIEDISDAIATLALQGPLSRAVLQEAAGADFAALKYFRLTTARIGNIPLTVTRTGYTGDLGYEIWIEAARAVEVWDALLETGRNYQLTPAGMLALDLARIEAGLLLIDVDYTSAHHALIESRTSTPFELSLDWTVNLDKEQFNGKTGAAGRKTTRTCLEVRGDRSGVGRAGKAVCRAPPAATTADDGVAHEHSALCQRALDRLRFQRMLVALVEEVYRFGARARALRAARHTPEHGSDRGTSAAAGGGACDEAAVL